MEPENSFYMVWVIGKTTPTKRHTTIEEARIEGKRLAAKEHSRAYVLHAVGFYAPTEPVWTGEPPEIYVEVYVQDVAIHTERG